MLVQRALPGFASPVRRQPRRRRRVAPALSESRAASDRAYTAWRQAFVEFMARLPERRRAELRRRLNQPTPAPARPAGLTHAA